MRKKLITSAAVLALLMNAPQVSADDDIVIFGGEFEDEAESTASKKIKKPAPKKVDTPAPKPPAEKLPAEKPPVEKPPVEKPPVEKPTAEPEVVKPKDEPPTKPIEQPEADDENFGDVLIFNDVSKIPAQNPPTQQPKVEPKPTTPIEEPTIESLPPIETNRPFEHPTNISDVQEPINEPAVIVQPSPESTLAEKPARRYFPSSSSAPVQSDLKMLKPRFIKLAVDDTYIYYLDKTSVQWKRMPYMANEYMADVWVRMIEREPKQLDDDMAYYGADNFRAQIALAREKGYQYSPEDIKVLRQQSYVLEHYYLRPKTQQIQFLCELEVFGRPQNAINERAYDYKNWENLVPGSVESAIYDATIKIIGKSKANERGHMTFADMLDEYARIALN